MNLPTLTMDPKLAKEKLKAFRAARHKDAEELYRQTTAAYEQLAKGTPLIRLSLAFQQAGLFDDGRPKLAIARSDQREVKFDWSPNTNIATFNARQGRQRAESLFRRVDMGRPHGRVHYPQWSKGQAVGRHVMGFALVPMVPADVRPARGQLADWFTLWEVDQWFDNSQMMKAPIDPVLLKPIGGDLYGVLAQWDLTPIEQAILEGAMR